MEPKLIQIIVYHDYVIGLDSLGRLWKIYPQEGHCTTSMSLIAGGDLPE